MAREDYVLARVTIREGAGWHIFYLSTSVVTALIVVKNERPDQFWISGRQLDLRVVDTEELPELEEGLRWAASHTPTGDPKADTHYLATFPRPSRRRGARRR